MESIKDVQEFVCEHKIASVTILTGLCLYAIRRYVKGRLYHSTRRLDGRTVIITGANTGIGKETAIDLAKRGARVIIACRDMEKAETALTEIKKRSGNTNVQAKKLDLASLKSVRSFAEDINNTEARLDILLNNAGVMICPYWHTEDGFEMQFGTNHLGHFLLTNLLLDLIKKSAPSRIVNVSSMGHRFTSTIEFNDIAYRRKNYNRTTAYAQSKLSNILFTKELARRLEGSGVTTYSLHPGAIHTELQRHFMSLSPTLLKPVYTFYSIFSRTPYEGAQTNIYCAIEESLDKESGKYYNDCREEKPSKLALDDGNATKLWELSEQLVGLHTDK